MTVPGGWLPLKGLSRIPYAFGSVLFMAPPSFLGTIPQAYILLMGLISVIVKAAASNNSSASPTEISTAYCSLAEMYLTDEW